MGRAKEIVMKVIPSGIANPFIKAHHYSGKVVNNSKLHFGIFLDGQLHGVMSYGPSLDKSKIIGLVEGTGWNEFLELNRMAFDSVLPRNSESRAISMSIKLLKKYAPQVKWITTSPSVGSSTLSSFTTGTLYGSDTITVTAKVTDTRGRTATKTTSFYVHFYSNPYFLSLTFYRCNSSGVQDDTGGTYAYLKADFDCYDLDGKNSVTGQVVLSQVGGSYSTTKTITSGTGVILGGGNLAVDAVYEATFTLTDATGAVSTYVAEIGSAEYVIHVKNGGKAIGFGMAAGDDETASFGWPVKMSTPLAIEDGGTGASDAMWARFALGCVGSDGDTMTGDLTIQGQLYPSLILKPTYSSTTNRTAFEGSYVGASSFSAWEDNSGNNRRMLEIRTAKYQSSLDNAVVSRNVVDGSYYSYRLFHAGMASPVPVNKGSTGATDGKAALSNLGIFYADTLPSTGTDGQICLVPV